MIVSHSRKFIFLKTRKTAGTSLEIALSKYCGPEDVLAPINYDEDMRRQVSGRGKQNYARPFLKLSPIQMYRNCMSVVSHKARLVYVVVPKAACTSVKTMLYDLDVGGDRRPKQSLRERLLGRPAPEPTSIHQIDGYMTRPFTSAGVPEGFARFAVLRDPLSRLHSAWSNKTGSEPFGRRGETGAILAAGLPVDPTFGEFLEGYERYRALSVPAAVHTRPLRWHLGDDLGWYDRLFRLEAIADLEPWISERAGVPVRLARENRGAHGGRPLGLKSRHIDLAGRILADDYTLLAGLYDFKTGLADFHRRHALVV